MNQPATHFDVVVVGGGSAGVAAAVAAARSGAKVALFEKYGFLGGQAVSAMVGTVCGLYLRSDKPFQYANHGFTKEFCLNLQEQSHSEPRSWREGLSFLPYEHIAYQNVCADYLQQSQNVHVFLHAEIQSLQQKDQSIDLVDTVTPTGRSKISATAFVDCTGESSLSGLCQAERLEDELRQSGAFVFSLTNLKTIEESALTLLLMRELRRVADSKLISEELSLVSVIPGSFRNGQVFMKLGVGELADDERNLTKAELNARNNVSKLVTFLRQNVEYFKDTSIGHLSSQVGVRTGRRAVGKYTLSKQDVLTARKHEDGVAAGAWPVEWWGRGRAPSLEFFAKDETYDIPAGCLMSKSIPNLFFAGRGLSASTKAAASARVIGTALSTGFAAGRLAAFQASGRPLDAAISELRKEQVCL